MSLMLIDLIIPFRPAHKTTDAPAHRSIYPYRIDKSYPPTSISKILLTSIHENIQEYIYFTLKIRTRYSSGFYVLFAYKFQRYIH